MGGQEEARGAGIHPEQPFIQGFREPAILKRDFSHFADEETEVQNGAVTCPTAPSQGTGLEEQVSPSTFHHTARLHTPGPWLTRAMGSQHPAAPGTGGGLGSSPTLATQPTVPPQDQRKTGNSLLAHASHSALPSFWHHSKPAGAA